MRSDEERLRDIEEYCVLISGFIGEITTSDGSIDTMARQYAVLHNLMIIGEAAARISPELQLKYPEVGWRVLTDLRNIVVHEYFGVDWNQVWEAATSKVPKLATQVGLILINEFGG
jgi:uncharacterized protein with HEPN domain